MNVGALIAGAVIALFGAVVGYDGWTEETGRLARGVCLVLCLLIMCAGLVLIGAGTGLEVFAWAR